jgi:filamentous hemagglutinin family protein
MVASMGNHPGNWLGLQVWTIAALFGFGGAPAFGQPIVPDASLGSESSRVETGPIDRISGGAQRGTSLFHSFAEFNVLAGQRVYFGNPIGVANIFSRVTGSNASAIDGTLGVVGAANLFLLNPNGILLGPNAKLDIAGSFMASTASDWRFSNGTTFSAVTANPAPLLDVGLVPGLQLGRGQGPIAVNSALTVGQSLTLSADRLTLNGSLTSGGNLRLDGRRIIGLDPVIRSAGDVELPFYEGNSLHIIAGGSVSIPDYVWIQGADPIGGLVETVTLDDGTTQAIDGRTIPTLDIRAGSLAGGAPGASGTADIDLGTVVFAGADSDFDAGVINPIAGQLFLTNRYQANPLLDGDITIESPLGGLEGRAVINGDSVRGGDVFLSSRGAIAIDGDIDVEAQTSSLTNAIGNGGQIQMTAVGEIDLTAGTSLNASGLRGGTIALASADRIVLVGSTLDSQSFGSPIGPIQEGGTIVLIAPEIALDSTFVTTTTSGTITGGTIALLANNILLSNGSQIQASTIGPGQGGNVAIRATDTVLIDGVSDFQNSDGNSLIDLDSAGNPIGGLSSGVIVSTEAPPGSNPLVAITGNAGALAIEADALIVSNGGVISSRSRSQGNGGAMSIEVGNLSLLDGGQILAPAYSSGSAGNIGIAASRGIRIAGRDDGFDDRVTQLKDAFKAAGLSPAEVKLRTESWVDPIVAQSGIIIDDINGLAKPGGLLLGSPSLKMGEGSLISSNSRGREDAGTIALSVQDLSLSAGAQIISSTFGSGKGGNVVITPQDETQPSSVSIDGVAEVNFAGINNILSQDVGGYSSGIIVNAEDGDEGPGVTTGTGGNLLISTTNLTLSNGGVLTARSQSGGNGGDMFINVDRAELSSGGQIVLSTFSSGNGGQVLLNANQTIVAEGVDETRTTREAELLAGFTAFFSAQIPALDPATIAQKAQEKTEFTLDTVSPASGIVANVEKGGSGTGGFIFATATDSIELKDSAEITASTFGSGDSGNILLQADRINFDNGDIRTIVEGGATGNGGEIVVIGNKSITLSGGSQIASAVFRATVDSSGVEKPGGKGDAGKVGVKAPDILIEGRNDRDFKSGLFASTERGAEGNGGAIFVEADRLTIRDDGLINASTSNTFNGGSIDIDLTGQLTIADGGSIIADGDANIPNAGNPGNIKISARNILFGDEGKISAITDSGANANIVLTLKQGILFNGQDSEISTDAQGPGNGGSIFIRLGTNILTDLDANNDIVATSVGGRGGRISILNGPTAKVETFRIAEKGVRRTPQSDLTASSDINQNGTIFIAADAAGLIRPSLPVLPDRPPQVTQTCKATTIANGEFFITGRGGLPTDPSDRRASFEPLSDWSTLSSRVSQGVAYVPPEVAAKPIEATSWDGRMLGRGEAIALDWRVPCLDPIEGRGANFAP